MGKKRKQVETSEDPKKEEELEPARPKRTLLGFKDGAIVEKKSDHPVFKNKEKVLVTCSRRIIYREILIVSEFVVLMGIIFSFRITREYSVPTMSAQPLSHLWPLKFLKVSTSLSYLESCHRVLLVEHSTEASF